jgi:ATP-binding cassette subfamily B protein
MNATHTLSPEATLYRAKRPFATLWALYRSDWSKIALAMLFFLIKNSPSWLIPVLTAQIIDIVAARQPGALQAFWLTGVLMIILVLQNAPMNYIHFRFLSLALRNMEARLRAQICRQLQQLSINFYQRHSIGALATKVLRDVEQVELMTRQVLRTLPSVLLGVTIATVMIGLRAPWFLLFFAIVVPSAALLRSAFRQRIRDNNHIFRGEVEGMSAHMVEMIRLIPVTRAHGVEEEALNRAEERLNNVRSAGLRLDSVDALFSGMSWTTMHLASTICLLSAGYVYYTQTLPITLGDIVLLTGLFSALTDSVLKVAELMPQIGRGFESIQSISEVLESPDLEENTGKKAVKRVKGAITFEQVSFSYPQSSMVAVHNISFQANPGDVIAIVGPSGAGKSTLLNLLLGFIRPNGGRILLDKHDMQNIDMRSYRQSVAVVSQETILFNGTVRENVCYGATDISDTVLEQALRDANALEFVEKLASGVDTLIGENGARLSGGQKQRLAIARALIRNPQVLILDEPTSALDAETETAIQEALERLMQGRTTFFVAHRLATIQHADHILVMENGQIIEVGQHRELVEQHGLYAQLCRLQALA